MKRPKHGQCTLKPKKKPKNIFFATKCDSKNQYNPKKIELISKSI